MSIAAVSLAGVLLFVWPFLGLGLPPEVPAVAVTVGAVASLALMEAGARRLDSGRLALLAALAAIDAALRLALVNGIGGFSPIFFLVLCAGYEFGASYGFLVGGFSLLVSALVTGGIGPWLPYETFAVGWVGASAGLAGSVVRRLRPSRRSWLPARLDLAVLVGVAIATGFAYGALTDIWGWVAFYRGVENIGWLPGLSAADALARFGRYYALTSLTWDAFRAAGDALAVVALGTPVLMALGRLRARLGYEVVEGSVGELAAA
ncbi:MAG: ECF transporter S component [Candidatus Limnocylindrales bacterium]|jgi:energy-coupling factor transport system substrate-specific component